MTIKKIIKPTPAARVDLHFYLSGLDANGITGLAEKLDVCRSTVYRWSRICYIPNPWRKAFLEIIDFNFGADGAYKKQELEQWLEHAQIKKLVSQA